MMTVATPTGQAIVLTKWFAAPRRRVFDAHTRPGLLRRWFGPHGSHLVVCEIDLRPGGSWYYLLRGADGTEMRLRGTYLEIVPPELLVTTESNVDCYARAEHEALATAEFADDAGGTLLTNTIHFPTKEIRDAVLGSGMERGVAQGYDRLAELVAPVSGPAPAGR